MLNNLLFAYITRWARLTSAMQVYDREIGIGLFSFISLLNNIHGMLPCKHSLKIKQSTYYTEEVQV